MTHTEVPKMARVVIRRRRRRQCCFIVLIKSSVGGARWLRLRSCEDVHRRAMVGDVETAEGDDSPCQVVDIMRVNVDKVLERDQKLSELDDRADALQAGASQFESSAAKLKRKYWWKNCKMWAILIAVILIIVIIIIVWSVSG
uniref:V-SNARE coiled-coil homology domain-containing protein n=1 Tax=Knipowitschia caucasica TaxID=637954 RepID=A0AAV2M9E9_KNICA